MLGQLIQVGTSPFVEVMRVLGLPVLGMLPQPRAEVGCLQLHCSDLMGDLNLLDVVLYVGETLKCILIVLQ
jgi:hypothetical protein